MFLGCGGRIPAGGRGHVRDLWLHGWHHEESDLQGCLRRTHGAREAVQVEFDPSRVSYLELLAVFWKSHDPTTLNRQGPDVGSQYRSAIFFHDAQQEAAARASKDVLIKEGVFKKPIVTEIVPASEFYRAEEYHQQYFEKQGIKSCHIQ